MEVARAYLAEVVDAAQAVDMGKILEVVSLLERAYRERATVFIIGNGGSAANASHLAQDLAKGTLPENAEVRLRALCLAESTSFLTAVGNDLGFERVFEFQLRHYAEKGDVLIAISGSGNSPDVIRAVEYAQSREMTVVGLTGFDGGRLGQTADVHVHVPISDMCKSEAVHGILTHMIPDLLRDRLASST